MNRSVTLSLAAVDVLAQLLRVNPRRYPLEIPSVGEDAEERTRIARAVFINLAERGLMGPDGIAPRVERALRVIADPEVGVAVSGSPELGVLIRARGVVVGDYGVLAIQEGNSLRFDVVGAPALARALVGLLPVAPAGPGQSVRVDEPAPEPSASFVGPARAPRTAAQTQLRIATGILERPRTGFGFFTITTRGRHGDELDTGTLGWLDTDAGRYLTLTRPGGGATYSPADTARLTQQLDGLIHASR